MVTMANKDMIYIRDTRNGVASLMNRRMLDHPAFAEFFEEVSSDKPVVPELQKPRRARKAKDEVIVIEPVIDFETEEQ